MVSINLVLIYIQSRKFLIKMHVFLIFIAMVISTKNNKHIYYADMVSTVFFDVDKIELFQVTHRNVTSSTKKSHVGRAFSNDPNQR